VLKLVEAEKPELEEVSIRRTEIMVPTAEGPAEAMIYVTYTVKDLPPGLVTIPKKQWSEEAEVILVKKDIEERRKAKPTTIRI